VSADVIEFRKPVKPAQIEETSPEYRCLNCDGDSFKAYASGRLSCVLCGARIRNLFVREGVNRG
jgi:DNA-directed RNA polymerase subunit RPC12/RpoP